LDVEAQLELRNGSGGDALDAETQEELLLNSSNANPTETAETEHCNNTTANNCNNINNSNSNDINHKKLDTRNHNGDDATGNGSGNGHQEDDDGEGVKSLDGHGDAEKGGGIGGGGEGGGKGGPHVGGYPDELVLDVLNDDLIAQVRNKLNSGGKDIFAQCVNAVKAFLAGEPFREFESSMYFHRWVVLPFKE